MAAVEDTRAGYRYWLSIPTRWQDGDPYGHMNNVVYYAFFDTCLTRMLLDHGVLDAGAGSPIGLCVESQCRFLAPVSFPEMLDAGLRIGRIGNSSLRYELALFRQGGDVPVAQGYFVHVFVDRQTRRPLALDDAVKRRMEGLTVSRQANMRVVQFDAYGPPEVLRLTEAPVPTPPPGAVLVRNHAIGVNPADVKWRQGMFRDLVPLQLSHVLGYDIAGTIEAVGEGVDPARIGERVLAMLDPVVKGGYAEAVVISASSAAPLPDGIEFTTAAALPTPALTGVQLIDDHLQPSPGQTVLVTGAFGAVGRFAMFAARRRGARVVAAVRPQQIDAVLALGAERAIALGGDESGDDLAFDHVADTVGGPEVAALCRRLKVGGLIRTVATTLIDPAGLPTTPSFIAVRPDPTMLADILGAVARGEVTTPVVRRLPLADAVTAHRLVEAGGGGKIVLEP